MSRLLFLVVIATASTSCSHGGRGPDRALAISRTDDVARLFWDTAGRFDPEDVPIDLAHLESDAVIDLAPAREERELRAYGSLEREISARLRHERDPSVLIDLEVTLGALRARADRTVLSARLEVGYLDIHRIVRTGLSGVLTTDRAIDPRMRAAARGRLVRYAGALGSPSVPAQAAARISERLGRPGVVLPTRMRIEKDLGAAPSIRKAIASLVHAHAIAEADEILTRLDTELIAYENFVRASVLPRAREDFHGSPELYAVTFREYGIDADPKAVALEARAAFATTQSEIQLLATRVANERGLKVHDYRDVIRALRAEQLGPRMLATYEERSRTIDALLRREDIVPLVPLVPLRIRFATPSESSAIPVPFLNRSIGPSQVGRADFVLPTQASEDFGFDAAAWWLTAHEGRPGHELQFEVTQAEPLSVVRRTIAPNSANIEGWGLYAEALVFPFEPVEGQLATLQARLMRQAHAYLDIELNTGTLTPEEAFRIMRDDVAMTDAWAKLCVDRYTTRMPAQAPSYFYGYARLVEIRHEAERAMGARFRSSDFHRFVLSQGPLPLGALRKAVSDQFAR